MYNSETKDMVSKTDDLTKEEKVLFESAVTFAKENDVDLEGQAVSKIIADEKARLEEERQRLEEERKKEEERKREPQRQKEEEIKRLNDSIQVSLDGKGAIAKDSDAWRFSDVITFDLTFKNTTELISLNKRATMTIIQSVTFLCGTWEPERENPIISIG